MGVRIQRDPLLVVRNMAMGEEFRIPVFWATQLEVKNEWKEAQGGRERERASFHFMATR